MKEQKTKAVEAAITTIDSHILRAINECDKAENVNREYLETKKGDRMPNGKSVVDLGFVYREAAQKATLILSLVSDYLNQFLIYFPDDYHDRMEIVMVLTKRLAALTNRE